MNVTIVCDVLGKPNNGTSLAAYNLINHLKAKGHNVRVICPDKDKKDLDGFYILDTLKFGKLVDNYFKKNEIILSKAKTEIIRKACENADVVHCIVPFSASLAALKYCKDNNIPVTSGFHFQAENLTSHLFVMNGKVINYATYKLIWTKFYNRIDAIHYPTEFIRTLVTKYNKNNVKSYVISNGVNTKLFYPKQVEREEIFKDKYVILMSGRLSREKNQKELIKAVKLSKYESKIQLVFTGNGPLQNFIAKRGEKLTNKPIIRFYAHEELHDALWQADLYVHTSVAEIEAISVLEAFATGLVPIIANSKKSATKKFSLSKNCSYKSGDAEDLAAKIDYFIENPQEKDKLKEKYIEFAKQFDFDVCMNKMEEMLQEVIENHKK